MKARLCTREFKEQKDFPTDSPCNGVRSILALIASNRWEKINRSNGQPNYNHQKKPTQQKSGNFKSVFFSLANGSGYWYLQMREELIKLGANVNSVDLGIFYWKGNNCLVGLLACHVDNMIWAGNEMFETNIINNLKHMF